MPTLPVPGATLHYEISGAGPLLLLIPGGSGEALSLRPLAEHLADRYTVVSYDRRGFGRSSIPGDFEHRVELDGADAAALLSELSDQPAAVFGSSTGAIVTLELLTEWPELVHTLIAHEPPLASVLPDGDTWLALFDEVQRTDAEEGFLPAMGKFIEGVGQSHVLRNMPFWMECELLRYPRYTPDLHRLGKTASKLVLGVGQHSRDCFPALPNAELARRLDLATVEFPGSHVGYVHRPAEFADALATLLAARAG